MKAKKRATERNKLPDINWSDEVEVNSLSASKLKLYLKEHGLPVSGGKAALVARVLGAGEAQGKENPDEQQSSSSEDQEDNEQSDDSEIDDYEEQSFEVLFIPDDAGGGRKGDLKTAKPHRNTPKNRKPHRIFSRIPKPRTCRPQYES